MQSMQQRHTKAGVAVASGAVVFLVAYASLRFLSALGLRADSLGIPLFFRCAVGGLAAAATAIASLPLSDAWRDRLAAWLHPALAASTLLLTAQALIDP
jgi:hypothetical protein